MSHCSVCGQVVLDDDTVILFPNGAISHRECEGETPKQPVTRPHRIVQKDEHPLLGLRETDMATIAAARVIAQREIADHMRHAWAHTLAAWLALATSFVAFALVVIRG